MTQGATGELDGSGGKARTKAQDRRGGGNAAAPAQPESEQAWLAAVVEFCSDAILSKTLDGTITSWNAAAETMYGYPAAEAIGRSIEILVPEDRLDELRAMDSAWRAASAWRHWRRCA